MYVEHKKHSGMNRVSQRLRTAKRMVEERAGSRVGPHRDDALFRKWKCWHFRDELG